MDLIPGYSFEDIKELYIDKNYSMELVSRVVGMELAPLSHIFWDSGMAALKQKVNPNFVGEITYLPGKERKKQIDLSGNMLKRRSTSIEEDFFSEI